MQISSGRQEELDLVSFFFDSFFTYIPVTRRSRLWLMHIYNNTGFPAIVTRWHLKTRPLPELYQSLYFYPTSELSKVLQWVIDVSFSRVPLCMCLR